jgi:hypothetical protein
VAEVGLNVGLLLRRPHDCCMGFGVVLRIRAMGRVSPWPLSFCEEILATHATTRFAKGK